MATCNAFEKMNLKPEYGGVHSTGTTHMSLLGFFDGSYIEIISRVDDKIPSIWTKEILENAGPCAWAIQVDNIHFEVERIRKLGIPVIGPEYYFRKRPDGVLVEWELAFLGNGEPGTLLPFIIQDRTKRELRVRPSACFSKEYKPNKTLSALINGVAFVMLVVRNVEMTQKLFEKVFGSSDWLEDKSSFLNTNIYWKLKSPVILVSGKTNQKWLLDRIDSFGEIPCAFLFKSANLKDAIEYFDLTNQESLFNGQLTVAWFGKSKFNTNGHLGLVELTN
jgi:hypothetical protein